MVHIVTLHVGQCTYNIVTKQTVDPVKQVRAPDVFAVQCVFGSSSSAPSAAESKRALSLALLPSTLTCTTTHNTETPSSIDRSIQEAKKGELKERNSRARRNKIYSFATFIQSTDEFVAPGSWVARLPGTSSLECVCVCVCVSRACLCSCWYRSGSTQLKSTRLVSREATQSASQPVPIVSGK